MTLDRRQATRLLLAGSAMGTTGVSFSGFAFAKEDLHRSHGGTLVGELNYPADFKRFDYANPDAPKGGTVRIAAIGTFDSFNPFIVKGNAATGVGRIYDTLMTPALDASSTEYGLLAEWIEHPSDYSSVSFKIRDDARWHDGKPVTPKDVVFTFNMLIEKAIPGYRLYYANVENAEDAGDNIVRFTFDQKNNRELPHIMGQLVVMPEHYWKDRDFSKSSLDKPLGSGPYRIGDFEAGRHVEYERVEDYWGQDLPVNVGMNNFGKLRYEYYKAPNAAFEAFKAGKLDHRSENSSINWATRYDFPAANRGDVIKEEIETDGPKVSQTFVFNTRLDKFSDIRVREALALMFDFEWTNKAIFYGQYARPTSYFQGTADLMSSGLPEGRELEILEQFRDELPAHIFEKRFEMPVSDGSGRGDRRVLRRAKGLLKEAGWTVKDGKLVNGEGKPFEVEFLYASPQQERVVAPYLKNLDRLGIVTKLRLIDSAQYTQRFQAHDFDMVIGRVGNSSSPGNEQRGFWGSEAADAEGSRNTPGVKDPVVDALIEGLIFAKDREDLAAHSRALDRVLLWGHYGILELYTPTERVAWWHKKITKPDPTPSHNVGFPDVWWSAETET